MVHTKVTLVVVLAILVCVLATSPTPLVTETCSKTEIPDVCVSTLVSDPRSAEAKDAPALARIGIEILGTKYKETFKHINQLLNDPNGTYEQRTHRQPCWHDYNTTKDSVELDVLPMVDDNNYSGAALTLGQLKTAAEECNGYDVPELKEANTFVIGFVSDLVTILGSLTNQPTGLRGLKQFFD